MDANSSYWVLGHKVKPITVSGDFDMVIGETPVEVPGPPPHHHSRFNEMFLVLEGKMDFVVNDELHSLNAGESIDLPPNSVHTFKNAGKTPCKWLNVHSPKGFWSFFKEMGIPENEADGQKNSVDPSIIQKVMKEAVNYDMHIVLPK
jgi:mannose-6-phosphate isomerase-like protein (cupin superfamily)